MTNFITKYPVLIVTLILIAAYSPVLYGAYGEADDFDVLHDYWEIGTHMNTFLGSMRPLGGLLADLGYTIITPEFSNLWQFRLGHVLLLILFCITFAFTLKQLELSRFDAYSMALIISLSPAIQAMVSYSTMMFLPLAGIAGTLGFLCAKKALDNRARLIPYISASIILLVAGLSIYQIYPMIFWALVLAEMLKRAEAPLQALKRLFIYGLIFGAALVAYYLLAAKIIPHILDFETAKRTALTSNPVLNLAYFVVRPLRDALNLFSLSYYGPLSLENAAQHIPSYLSALLVALFIAWGLFKRYVFLNLGMKFILGVFTFGLLVMSYLPNMVVEALYTPYRTQYALSACVSMLVYFSIATTAPNAKKTILVTLLLCCFAFCLKHMHFDIVAPRQSEWQLVHQRTQTIAKDAHKTIFVAMPDEQLIEKKQTYYGEFGGMITMSDRGDEMVKVALRELGYNYKNFSVNAERLASSDPSPQNENAVIDMRSLYPK